MNQNTLLNAAAFVPDSLEHPNAWIGHLPFAAWVMQEISPKIFVELGTHTGNSYFSFCQSVSQAGISTKCYAVDTWQGDEHAGAYGDEIFVLVNAKNEERYSNFSKLLRMTFDDAVSYFSNESIDLLHIDGLHTYEAVRHDFESWLPKLAPGAVVLFHDTNVRERDFGVWKLWEELQARYHNNLEFVHSHGLGVLQLDNALDGKKLSWLQMDSPGKQQLITYFAALGSRQLERYALSSLLTERDSQIAGLNQAVADCEGRIAGLNQAVADCEGRIAGLNQTVADLDGQIGGLNQAVADREGRIAGLKQVVADCEGQIANLNQAVADCEGQIASLNRAVADRDGQIAHLNQIAAERDGQITGLAQEVAALRKSTCWRLTKPVRFVGHQLARGKHLVRTAPSALQMGGGPRETLKKALDLYHREGFSGVKRGIRMVKTRCEIKPASGSDCFDRNDYTEWVRRYDTIDDAKRQKLRARCDGLVSKPKISVVMPTYNPKPEWLIEAIESVRNQIYPNWELCIADDASPDPSIRPILERYVREDKRIKVVFREQNGHISAASNSALEVATGEWMALLDHDDLLAEHALALVAEAINDNPAAGLVYSDEDKIDEHGKRSTPYFKCAFNLDLLRSQNMICHLGAYRLDLVRDLGGFRLGFEGSQDYDLALRVVELLKHEQIVHVPCVLYHWRVHPESTALDSGKKSYAQESGLKALREHLQRQAIDATVELTPFLQYRVRYKIPSPPPKVSLIIPTRNGLRLIRQCLESILARTTYKNYEILIVDNGSDDPDTLNYLASLDGNSKIRVIRDDRPFNYSALNNKAVIEADSEYVGLLNNDLEVISPEWLDEMLGLATQPGKGAVGACLWYPNDTLQHGGVIMGIGGVAGHAHKNMPRGDLGYFGRAGLIHGVSGVTAACLLIKKSIYLEVGGLNEADLQVAFNDVDFCLKVREAGYQNVWTPFAELYHHESATRGFEDSPEKKIRFSREVGYMKHAWGDALLKDPAYSPNLTLDHEDFSLAWPPRTQSV
jgi:O-antigen biosynthesis protein